MSGRSESSGFAIWQLNMLFLVVWLVVWLYISLTMAVLSFGAIQLQNQLIDDFARDPTIIADDVTSLGTVKTISAAQMLLDYTHYQDRQVQLPTLQKEAEQEKAAYDLSLSSSVNRVVTLLNGLAPKIFSNSGNWPDDLEKGVDDKCKGPDLDKSLKTPCDDFNAARQNLRSLAGNRGALDDLLTSIVDNEAWIKRYEASYRFNAAENLVGLNNLTRLLIPFGPTGLSFVLLPHPLLVLIVTMSMGALGSVLFMLQLNLLNRAAGHIRLIDGAAKEVIAPSAFWHFFRPFQGIATALAVFLLVKAGQLSVGHASGQLAGDEELNVYVLGFLGVISGLISDRAISRLTVAGISIFSVSRPSEQRDEQTKDDSLKASSESKGSSAVREAAPAEEPAAESRDQAKPDPHDPGVEDDSVLERGVIQAPKEGPFRYELSDFEWSIIQPLLPNRPGSVPRANDRKVLNGIYWRLRTGSPWADIPERYGPATTCYNRFVRWAKIGIWDRIFEAVSKAYDGELHGANGKEGDLKKPRPPLGTLLKPSAWGAREAD
jgi:transposase